MKDEILNKAPGMKFVLDMGEEGAKLTPRVIHALGTHGRFHCNVVNFILMLFLSFFLGQRKYKMGIY